MDKLKSHPLTIGIAAAIIGAIIAVAGFSFRSLAAIEEVSAKSVAQHSQAALDLAHPGLRRFEDAQEDIRKEVQAIRESVVRIEARLSGRIKAVKKESSSVAKKPTMPTVILSVRPDARMEAMWKRCLAVASVLEETFGVRASMHAMARTDGGPQWYGMTIGDPVRPPLIFVRLHDIRDARVLLPWYIVLDTVAHEYAHAAGHMNHGRRWHKVYLAMLMAVGLSPLGDNDYAAHLKKKAPKKGKK